MWGRRMAEWRYRSSVRIGEFRSQFEASSVSSPTEDLWFNETVCLWMTIYIYICSLYSIRKEYLFNISTKLNLFPWIGWPILIINLLIFTDSFSLFIFTAKWLEAFNIIIIIIIIYSFRVFHISVSWWFFAGVWVTASLLKCPGLVSGFWPFLAMLSFG